MYYYYGIFGPRNHDEDGLLGRNSMMVVYMDPLGRVSGLGLSPSNARDKTRQDRRPEGKALALDKETRL